MPDNSEWPCDHNYVKTCYAHKVIERLLSSLGARYFGNAQHDWLSSLTHDGSFLDCSCNTKVFLPFIPCLPFPGTCSAIWNWRVVLGTSFCGGTHMHHLKLPPRTACQMPVVAEWLPVDCLSLVQWRANCLASFLPCTCSHLPQIQETWTLYIIFYCRLTWPYQVQGVMSLGKEFLFEHTKAASSASSREYI